MLKNLIYICLGLGFIFLLLLLLIKPFREFVLKIYKQYKEIINYVVVGGLTTVIAIGTLYIFNSLLNIRVEIANVLSWICAVIFAFVFNKLFVFESKEKDLKTVSREFTSFGKVSYIMNEIVDKKAELEKITKELARLESEIARSNGMLSNEKFISKAPQAKVDEEKAKLQNYQNSYNTLLEKNKEFE